jgi:hypothetical protein
MADACALTSSNQRVGSSNLPALLKPEQPFQLIDVIDRFNPLTLALPDDSPQVAHRE